MSTHATKVRNSNQKTHRKLDRPPFECIALLLQGGGALGAYQAGVYQGLSEAHLDPDWVAGISIGAINSALIAGNAPEARLEKLRAFWDRVSSPLNLASAWPLPANSKASEVLDLLDQAADLAAWMSAIGLALVSGQPADRHANDLRALWEKLRAKAHSIWTPEHAAMRGDAARGMLNRMSASVALAQGVGGFFTPRVPMPWLQPNGSLESTSYYDSSPLKATLESLVDFDRINSGQMRFSVGAVNVITGNFVYFDNATHTIKPEHIMASGALPPGFPAVEIEGEYYWDGGLVSNTPLQWVLENEPRRDTLAFQVDLWSARGAFPGNMAEVVTRQKEIQYSSRTRANSDRFKNIQKIRNALSTLLTKLPEELRDSPELATLRPVAEHRMYNLVQLIYRSKQYEGDSKDYEFSRRSMDDHWRAGYHDTVRTLRHPEVLERPVNDEGVLTFDLAQDGRE
jgi:NTE family protein